MIHQKSLEQLRKEELKNSNMLQCVQPVKKIRFTVFEILLSLVHFYESKSWSHHVSDKIQLINHDTMLSYLNSESNWDERRNKKHNLMQDSPRNVFAFSVLRCVLTFRLPYYLWPYEKFSSHFQTLISSSAICNHCSLVLCPFGIQCNLSITCFSQNLNLWYE